MLRNAPLMSKLFLCRSPPEFMSHIQKYMLIQDKRSDCGDKCAQVDFFLISSSAIVSVCIDLE